MSPTASLTGHATLSPWGLLAQGIELVETIPPDWRSKSYLPLT